MAEAGGMETKYHYFAYSFVFSQGQASVYIGHPDQLITVPRIVRAKQAAGVPRDAVLLAVSYMGFMTSNMVESYQ
jgi:hypothetical protein